MRKNDSHFFIQLVPSLSGRPKIGAPTHYAKNSGITPLRFDLTTYIASQAMSGKAEPELFVCAWLDTATNEINVGFEIPRSRKQVTTEKTAPTPEVKKGIGLENMFE
jgi:hypothetical protein